MHFLLPQDCIEFVIVVTYDLIIYILELLVNIITNINVYIHEH